MRCLEEYRQRHRTILYGAMGAEHDLENDVHAWNDRGAEQVSLLVVRTRAAAKGLVKYPKRNIPVFHPPKPFPFAPPILPIFP